VNTRLRAGFAAPTIRSNRGSHGRVVLSPG
jgi:hypothetical protein